MENKSKITVYKNEMNMVPFRKFNSVEMDLFFAICTKMRDKGLCTVKFSFKNLKILSKYTDKHSERFISDLRKTYDKMLNLKYSKRYINQNGEDIESHFILFNGFEINRTNEYVDISINPRLKDILNEISSQFTKFDLAEFTQLRSSYSKTMFRLLKQYRLTGYYKVKIEDFKELLDIPKSYRMTDINKKVLLPIKNELTSLFNGLVINKLKVKNKNQIEYLEFTFKPQDDIQQDGNKIFRDKEGRYYYNNLENFSQSEIDRSLPDISKKTIFCRKIKGKTD